MSWRPSPYEPKPKERWAKRAVPRSGSGLDRSLRDASPTGLADLRSEPLNILESTIRDYMRTFPFKRVTTPSLKRNYTFLRSATTEKPGCISGTCCSAFPYLNSLRLSVAVLESILRVNSGNSPKIKSPRQMPGAFYFTVGQPVR